MENGQARLTPQDCSLLGVREGDILVIDGDPAGELSLSVQRHAPVSLSHYVGILKQSDEPEPTLDEVIDQVRDLRE